MDEVAFEKVVPIIDGKVRLVIPDQNLAITFPVKQTRGRGTHDAIKLRGTKASDFHVAIINALLNGEHSMTAEEIRNRAKSELYFDGNEALAKKFAKQSNFQRPFSELRYWKVLDEVGRRGVTPIYTHDMVRCLKILEDGF